MDELTDLEKHSLMICIMRDIRDDWSEYYKERAIKVKELAIDLKCQKTINLVDTYFDYIDDGDNDGRHFRRSWLEGGYESAPLIAYDKELRIVFIKSIIKNCIYPENAIKYILEMD